MSSAGRAPIAALPVDRLISHIEAALTDLADIESRRPRFGYDTRNFKRRIKLKVRPEITRIDRGLRGALEAARAYGEGPGA